MICWGYYYVSGWVSVWADSGCFFMCSARVKSHMLIRSLSCLQCCGENKTTLLSAQLHHSPSAAWGAVVTQRGVTLKSKEQTQLINMRGQDWPDCLWSQICGEESWAARVCVQKSESLCDTHSKKSGTASLVLLKWLNESIEGWLSGVFENRSDLDYFQAAWGRSVCGFTRCCEAGELSPLYSEHTGVTLCKWTGVWQGLERMLASLYQI